MKKILVVLITSCFSLPMFAQDVAVQANENDNDPASVVKKFLMAYMAGDHQKFSSLLHPEVVWIQPGDNRVSGVKKSKTELLQMGALMSELSARTLKLIDVKYYSANANTVVCILHWRAVQPTGLLLDVNNIDVYTVEDGKIVVARIFSENIEKEDDFWGK
jgi:uncharacterized protein